MLADVKSSCCGRGLARWRRACWPRRRKSWPMSSLCSTKRASPKTSSVLEAHSPLALSRAALRSRVEECWHLTEQNEMYEAFIALFRPSTAAAARLRPVRVDAGSLFPDPTAPYPFLSPGGAQKTRCYRKSSCRRIGQGQTARQLCINIYQRVSPGALAFVSEKGESSVGELPAPGPLYYQRFGGLPGA